MSAFTDFLALGRTKLTPERQAAFDSISSALVANFPEVVAEGDKAILLHKDYSRVIREVRQNPISVLDASGVEITINPETSENDFKKRYSDLVAKLDEFGVKELLLPEEEPSKPEDNQMKVEMTPAEYTEYQKFLAGGQQQQQSQFQQQPQFQQPPVQQAQPIPTQYPFSQNQFGQPQPAFPGQPASNQPVYLTAESLPQLLAPMFSQMAQAQAQIPLVLAEFASDYSKMTGKPLSPAEVGAEWTKSGKPFEDFIQEKYQVDQVRAEYDQKQFEQRVQDAAAQRVASQLASNGTIAAIGSFANNPVFASMAQNPKQNPTQPIQQAIQQPPSAAPLPTQPPAAPGEQPNATQPAPRNSPMQESGVMAAAQALATGAFVNERFNPVRQLA